MNFAEFIHFLIAILKKYFNWTGEAIVCLTTQNKIFQMKWNRFSESFWLQRIYPESFCCILLFIKSTNCIDWNGKVNKNIYFLKRKTVVMEFCMNFDSGIEQSGIQLKAPMKKLTLGGVVCSIGTEIMPKLWFLSWIQCVTIAPSSEYESAIPKHFPNKLYKGYWVFDLKLNKYWGSCEQMDHRRVISTTRHWIIGIIWKSTKYCLSIPNIALSFTHSIIRPCLVRTF